MNRDSTLDYTDRDSGSHRRLADATLAHDHDETVIGLSEFLDQIGEARDGWQLKVGIRAAGAVASEVANSDRSASSPTMFLTRRGTSLHGKSRNSAGILESASAPRHSNAFANGSLASVA